MIDEVVPRLLCILTFCALTSYSLQWATELGSGGVIIWHGFDGTWGIQTKSGGRAFAPVSGFRLLMHGIPAYFIDAESRSELVRRWNGMITWSAHLLFWAGMVLAFLNRWRWSAVAAVGALLLGALWMVDFQRRELRSFDYGYYWWLACLWVFACLASAMTLRRQTIASSHESASVGA